MVRTACTLLIALLAAGCSSRQRVVVGSKNFTEQVILGELLAQQIERAGLEVDRKLNLSGTLLAHEAMKSGSIDLYPEYTGTALTAVLKAPVDRDRATVLTRVRDGYRQWGLTWLDPLGFDNTFAMVVRTDTAQKQNLRTLTDAASRSEPWRIGVGYEFTQRPDGLQGLLKTYNLRLSGSPTTMDLGLLYPALEKDKIDLAAASATDGFLSRPQFTMLADDRKYFPPYESAVVVRDAALSKYPALRNALQALSARISDVEMRKMNAAVDIEHRPVADVAREFLARLEK